MQRNSPQFIGIGAEYAGLGVITRLLADHPDLSSSIPALNFFNTDAFEDKGVSWYQSIFTNSESTRILGECSPGYLQAPGVAARIVSLCPDAKLFVVVRNPLDRAIAQYKHARTSGQINEQISCAQYLTTHPSAQTAGFYGKYLHDFFAYYSSLQLHVMVYEDFVSEPLKVMQTLYTFLEVDPNFIPKALAQYAPPPDEPKHRGRISRLIHFVVRLIKKARTKPAISIVPPPFALADYFSATELVTFKRVFAVDSTHLTNLLHRDMPVFWDLLEVPTRALFQSK